MYVPRVRANAYHVLTTPPRVSRDHKMCLRNIWTAPYDGHWQLHYKPLSSVSCQWGCVQRLYFPRVVVAWCGVLVCGDGDQSLAPNEGSLSYLLLKYANYTGKNSHVVMSQNLSFSNKASAAAASSWTGAIRNQDSDLQRSLRVQGDPSAAN